MMFEARPIARAVSAAAIACLFLASCSGGSSTGVPSGPAQAPLTTAAQGRTAGPDAANALYVSDNVGKSVFRFVIKADGTLVAPPGSSLVLPYNPGAIAIGKKGNLFVVSQTNNSLQVYKPLASGSANPIRHLNFDFQPTSVAVDAKGYVYVGGSTNGFVSVYAPGAHGFATPVQKIALPDRHPAVNGVAVDTGRNLYMSDTNEVSEFSTPTTNPTLQRAIIGNGQQASPSGMSLDASGELYVANTQNSNILAYSSTANGTAAADRIISSTGPSLQAPVSTAIKGTTLYCNSGFQFFGTPSVFVFDALQGSQAPKQVVTGAYLALPVGVAVGP
jgi:sugar lactone lactonase YvrE